MDTAEIISDKVALLDHLTTDKPLDPDVYLKATGFRLGLLVNFGYYPKVEYEHIVI